MSKIIIDSETDLDDMTALELIKSVVRQGKRSGENQYCFATHFKLGVERKPYTVIARKSRGNTHSFKITHGE